MFISLPVEPGVSVALQ